MSAQYRPYRDEDSIDGLEATSWTDNEPGTIQIYEKTTEELPFGSISKKTLLTQIALLISVGILGFFLGFFTTFHRTIIVEDGPGSFEQLESYYAQEDPTVKDRILSKIDGRNILRILEKYQNTNRLPGSVSDHDLARDIHEMMSGFDFDRVTHRNSTFQTRWPKRPSVVSLLTRQNKTLFTNIDLESYDHDDMRPILPLSQGEETIITTDQIIYVNKGTLEDYAKLTSLLTVSNLTEGHVFVIRQTFYKAHQTLINAQMRGAVAVLLFPDPDTYGDNAPFPTSLRLPDDAGRSYPTAWNNYGDLALVNLSLGLDMQKLAQRAMRITIPVIPISFKTAQRLLRGLSGVQAPKEWNCFDFTLYLGPGYRDETDNGDQRHSIKIEFYNEHKSITTATVSGVITGISEPDRYILVGSRRDSLNRGLLDSISGTAVMLETARIYGLLLKQGWRPKRTIIFNSFGAETLNLLGSNNWLEEHQKLIQMRAVAYLNCEMVVIGNQTSSIAASPLMYQTLFNSTKQITDPNREDRTVYDSWKEAHKSTKKHEIIANRLLDPELEKVFEEIDSKVVTEISIGEEDNFGTPGNILREYKKSAFVKTRPKLRRLDSQSLYSPFLHYAGIPVVDVRFAGYLEGGYANSTLLEEMLPLIGTKYDNLFTIQQIDPHLKYHIAVTQMVSEILRDLSDSMFLPFNLLDYAVTLKDSFETFQENHGKTFNQSKIDLDLLKNKVQEFAKVAIKFHHRQDLASLKDAMKVRRINDQLMLLERAFLEHIGVSSFSERKHTILASDDGPDQKLVFPELVDWITSYELEKDGDGEDQLVFIEILKMHYNSVIQTISLAISIINEVHIL